MTKKARVFVAGHRGLAGSAIVRKLQAEGYSNLLLASRQAVDLRQQSAVEDFFARERPEYVFLAAAKVGGIYANDSCPAEFLHDNLQIQTNVIHAAWKHGVRKLLFLGSSCIYPRLAPQPIREEYLLTGELEPTNEAYAVAKIAGIKMCQAYHKQYGFRAISIMPTNLYGPGDNFDLQSSHVLPALLRKFHEAAAASAPEVTVWGTGSPRREFLHADDLASAAVFLMLNYESPEILNVGTGEDLMIRELAGIIAQVTGFQGQLVFDDSKPDGTPRKVLDVSRIHALGWKAQMTLEHGIAATYQWYLSRQAQTVAP
ncbi:MAG TPA: GDP-L-fucose synthase [Bryobacteraceae bacterium]|jgi:GDP-L-fucose synthase